MPCYRPIKGYRSKTPNEKTGKCPVVFKASDEIQHRYELDGRRVPVVIDLPCGQCIGCRLERSRQWAIRCCHEAQLYERNCFITLTYNDNNLPENGSLDLKHFQDFMKRLRFRFGEGIRFFHCGEYGERFRRPHYHACLFNFDFDDKVIFRSDRGNNLYVSKALEELWPFGFSLIGEVTFESAAYVARYITKKITGDRAESHYDGRKPEYTTMSRRPGIGRGWLDKYHSDVYPSDFVVIKEKKMKPPKYYDRQYEVDYPSDFKWVKVGRRIERKEREEKEERPSYHERDRLLVREEIQFRRLEQLKRSYENETEDV